MPRGYPESECDVELREYNGAMYAILGDVNFNDGFRRKSDAIAEARSWVASGEDATVFVRDERTDKDVYVCWVYKNNIVEARDPKVIGRVR